MTRRKLAVATLLSFGAWMAVACADSPIGAPVGDQNFDDPDNPGQSGQANYAPEAGDANGKFCVAARDCPAAFVCAYPIANACGAVGSCMPYTPVAGCNTNLACACDGTTIDLCAPQGYATKPVTSSGACDGASSPDTGTADDGATTDAASATDSASDGPAE